MEHNYDDALSQHTARAGRVLGQESGGDRQGVGEEGQTSRGERCEALVAHNGLVVQESSCVASKCSFEGIFVRAVLACIFQISLLILIYNLHALPPSCCSLPSLSTGVLTHDDLQYSFDGWASDKPVSPPMLVFLAVHVFLPIPPLPHLPLTLPLCLYLCLPPRSPAPGFSSSDIYIGHGSRLELAKSTLARSGYALHFGPLESANVSMSHCEFVDAKFARCYSSYPA